MRCLRLLLECGVYVYGNIYAGWCFLVFLHQLALSILINTNILYICHDSSLHSLSSFTPYPPSLIHSLLVLLTSLSSYPP